jgi:hypothetical protein
LPADIEGPLRNYSAEQLADLALGVKGPLQRQQVVPSLFLLCNDGYPQK